MKFAILLFLVSGAPAFAMDCYSIKEGQTINVSADKDSAAVFAQDPKKPHLYESAYDLKSLNHGDDWHRPYALPHHRFTADTEAVVVRRGWIDGDSGGQTYLSCNVIVKVEGKLILLHSMYSDNGVDSRTLMGLAQNMSRVTTPEPAKPGPQISSLREHVAEIEVGR